MPAQEVLILAVTRMLSGVCTAGFTLEGHPVSHLCWVRPVKEHATLLLGDLTDADGRVIQCGDVVSLHLQQHRPNPPHTEDWVTDFIYQRPRLLRRLESERRARFFARRLDQAPQDVLDPNPTRSLCLVRPDRLWACFNLDPYSLKYQARIGFMLEGTRHSRASSSVGIPVTDLKWRALGRHWLDERGGEIRFDDAALRKRLQADQIYLALGLSRGYQGQLWLLVIGVHVVPDYGVEIDYEML
jgi:hypothetical protein